MDIVANLQLPQSAIILKQNFALSQVTFSWLKSISSEQTTYLEYSSIHNFGQKAIFQQSNFNF